MLAFAEHVHGFVALDRPLRGVECPTPQPRVHLAFHQSMILLRHMIHILAWSEKAGLREGSVVLESVEAREYAAFLSTVITRGVSVWGAWST